MNVDILKIILSNISHPPTLSRWSLVCKLFKELCGDINRRLLSHTIETIKEERGVIRIGENRYGRSLVIIIKHKLPNGFSHGLWAYYSETEGCSLFAQTCIFRNGHVHGSEKFYRGDVCSNKEEEVKVIYLSRTRHAIMANN